MEFRIDIFKYGHEKKCHEHKREELLMKEKVQQRWQISSGRSSDISAIHSETLLYNLPNVYQLKIHCRPNSTQSPLV
jgi:hypothetical protein